MYSYHCKRNLEIYVTVVNRSSTLSWMTSEWFCWSWNMPIYLSTLLFFLFLLKELIKCKSPNEKRYWAAKACRTYLYLTRKKGKRPKIKIVWCPKSQRLTHQSEISKISSIDLTMRCVDSKRSNDMSNMEPNEKLQRYCTQVYVGGHICIFL